MGSIRTTEDVAKLLSKNLGVIQRWHEEWKWDERVVAWDNFTAKQSLQKAADDYLKMLEMQINLGKTQKTNPNKAKAYDPIGLTEI